MVSIEEMSLDDHFIPDGMNGFERNVKRVVDCVLAFIALIVFSPLFLICYIAVRLEDGGKAIFKQERIGRFGRNFYIYKFRSMRIDAEKHGPALYGGGKDSRLTKVGKFIREHHLDELPQLWNVFCGDMAFIGPRPERQFYIEKIMKIDRVIDILSDSSGVVTSYATLYNGLQTLWRKCFVVCVTICFIWSVVLELFDFKNFQYFMNIVFGKKF